MKAEFTPTDGGPETTVAIVDDANRLFGHIYELGGQAREQVTPLFRGDNPARFMRGNVAGQCVLAAWQSFASMGAAGEYLLAQYGLLNLQGTLKLTLGTATLTMVGATVREVSKEEWEGLFLRVRYTFGIGGFEPPERD